MPQGNDFGVAIGEAIKAGFGGYASERNRQDESAREQQRLKLEQTRLEVQKMLEEAGIARQERLDARDESRFNMGRRDDVAAVKAATLDPWGDVSESDAEILRGTPQEARMGRRRTLPSRPLIEGFGAPDAGGDEHGGMVWQPTVEDRELAEAKNARESFIGTLPRRAGLAARGRTLGLPVDAEDLKTDEELAGEQESADLRELGIEEAKEQIRARYRPAPQKNGADYVTLASPEGTLQMVEKGPEANRYLAQGWNVQDTGRARGPIGQERSALAFFNRAKQADDTIVEAGEDGSSLEDRIAGSGYLKQQVGKRAANVFQDEDQQAYRQAQRAFTEARLRKESGAAIPQGEYDNDARTYFVAPGDDANTIAQKREARRAVLDGIAFAAGPAYEEFYGEPYRKNAAGVNPNASRSGRHAAAPRAGQVVTLKDGRRVKVSSVDKDGRITGEPLE